MSAFSAIISGTGRAAVFALALPLSLGPSFAFAADTGGRAYFPPAPPQAGSPAPARPYIGICGSFFVRAAAKMRFIRQMRGVPHEPRLRVQSFSNIEEVQSLYGPESYNIDRHYCSATVTMNNGQSYPATYSVASGQGFAGLPGRHVSFCVAGLDNWLVRDNDCRSLRAPSRSVY